MSMKPPSKNDLVTHTTLSIIVFIVPPVVVALVFLCNAVIRSRNLRRQHEEGIARMAQNGGQSSLARDAPLPQLFEVRVNSHIDIGAWSAIQPLAVEFEHETGLQNEHDVESGEAAAVRRQPGISARRFRRVSRSRRRSRRETGPETAVNQGTATVTTLVMLPSAPRPPGHRDAFLRTEIALGVTTATCKRP